MPDEVSITKTLPKKTAVRSCVNGRISLDYQLFKMKIQGIYTLACLFTKQTTNCSSSHMKNPADYLAARVFEARRPRRELQPVVAYADAVQAIEQALADAEKYKYLLMRALRRHHDEVAPVAAIATPTEPRVLPLYPAELPLAA